jgi:hypothetical protein
MNKVIITFDEFSVNEVYKLSFHPYSSHVMHMLIIWYSVWIMY